MARARLIVLLLVLALATTTAGAVPLSTEQRARVERGDVVLLDLMPPGPATETGQGGTAVALVRATTEAVWGVLVDFTHHAGIYPGVQASTVVQSDPTRTVVRYVIGVGPFSFGFHVDNYPDEINRRLEWRLAEDRHNDLFRASRGYWQLDPDRHGVLLTYAMAARTVLPGFLTRGVERDGLLATVRAVRERAETRRGPAPPSETRLD